MSRVKTADQCFDRHEVEVKGVARIFFCSRRQGHPGYHGNGAMTWGTRWSSQRPAPGRTGYHRPHPTGPG